MIKNLLLIPYQILWPHWQLEMTTGLDYEGNNLYLPIKFLALYLKNFLCLLYSIFQKEKNKTKQCVEVYSVACERPGLSARAWSRFVSLGAPVRAAVQEWNTL